MIVIGYCYHPHIKNTMIIYEQTNTMKMKMKMKTMIRRKKNYTYNECDDFDIDFDMYSDMKFYATSLYYS
jgi:hypothetical protein